MKNFTIFLLTLIIISSLNTQAQVSINNDSSDPDASAMLDVKSSSMGLLIPRMTNAQMAAISSPANGLLVYSTDDDKLYLYNVIGNAFKEVQLGTGIVPLPASYTIGSGGACINTTVNGNYYAANVLGASNTVTMDATVSTTGDWSITTNSFNGYGFSGSGTFASTGTQQVTLAGSGTPVAVQTDNFTATAGNGNGTCTFSVTVGPVQNVSNPITGEIWMDRNLGASQVATSSSDAAAYGDLYQWGRLTDGHEDRGSGTTFTLSSTDDPGHSNFIKILSSPYDWRNPQNDNLWQGVSGTNNPCPSGYRIPTDAELDAERLSWAPNNNAAGAFGSPLKLTVGGYRAHSNGTFNNVGIHGYYWSSSISGTEALYLQFSSSDALMVSNLRASGFSVRCIKD